MGTRCITLVYDELAQPIVNIYRQFDGYPNCHGRELDEYMNGRKIINGIPSGIKNNLKYSNGMGCFAAGLIEHLKRDQIGNIYLQSVNEVKCGQDYEYHIYKNKIVVKNYSDNVMFDGPWDKFADFCEDDE